MAGPFVEAQSLSDITQLASNPPKYPRNPTEQRRQPLTLYIARVPGSRDIILTTLRPQLKNVTAEDVASSLYYLHLNTEDDLRFHEEEDHAAIPAESTSELAASMPKPLPRKPLPESARSSLDINPLAKHLTVQSVHYGGSVGVTGPRQPPVESKQTIPRRPLGPRPQQIEATIERKSLPGSENTPFTTPQEQAYLPKPSSETTRSFGLQNPAFTDSGKATQISQDTFSLTVIRRDPSSAAQWNVGTVSGRPTLEDANDRQGKASSPSRKPYFDLSIRITTPGYTYFRNSQPVGSLSELGTFSGQPATQDTRGSLDVGRQNPPLSQTFDREVRMEGSSFWARSAMQHKRTGSDLSDIHATTRGRSHSGSSATGFHGDEDQSDSQSKGYVLTSPWGGRCKFSTGSGGRTLRCRHSLPGPTGTTESLATTQAPATVSELRFNLPSAAVFESAKTALKKGIKDSGLSAKIGHIRQKLSTERASPPPAPRPQPSSYAARYTNNEDDPPPLPPRFNNTPMVTDSSDEGERPPLPERPNASSYATGTWDEEDDSRLDLSLGQEKAGGGNRGKRVKLGKLIIHDEGLKMLDLIVAANMGVWWSVW
ncbi:hypothetical protein LSUE1_G008722 [Lachnellula suecica]|uniref:Oxidoreductase-like protein n=1 Tax=Lachnellula suecica TaxID=602035 RepID=A0A8T9BSS1_9HELO|nr:hypothetical protein LSUE1_G008722 [Lachnellula suecica]